MAVTEQAAAIERARKGYTAFDAGDVPTVQDLIAEDAVWHVGGKSRYAGDYRGKQAIFEFFGRMMQEGFVQKHDLHDILANDQHTVVLANVTATYQGKTINGQVVDVLHRNADGDLTEYWRISSDQPTFDELIGS